MAYLYDFNENELLDHRVNDPVDALANAIRGPAANKLFELWGNGSSLSTSTAARMLTTLSCGSFRRSLTAEAFHSIR